MNAQMAAVVRESLARRNIGLRVDWAALQRGEAQDLRGLPSDATFDVAASLSAAVVLAFPANCVPEEVEAALAEVSVASARMELAVQRLSEAMGRALQPVFVEDAPSMLDIPAPSSTPAPETPEQFNERMAQTNGRAG